jgi:Flp pilus assembly protein TadD
LVQAALGRRELKNGNTQAAVEHLQQAIELGSRQSSTYIDLAEATEKSGRSAEALQFLEKAVTLDPFNPVLRKTLIVRLIQQKQYATAQDSLGQYLEIFPQDFFMRQMLAQAEGRTLPKTAK